MGGHRLGRGGAWSGAPAERDQRLINSKNQIKREINKDYEEMANDV